MTIRRKVITLYGGSASQDEKSSHRGSNRPGISLLSVLVPVLRLRGRGEERMMDRRRLIISAASVLAPALIARIAQAQEWPSRPVRLVVPYPAGGGADAIARIVSGRLADMWRQQVVIENRGGAGGNIASEAVARSAPDGYTLYLAGEFQATNSYLYPKLTYDPVADFL